MGKKLISVLLFCVIIPPLKAQKKKINYTFEIFLEIRNEEENLHFIYPKQIVTDSDGNIFISDQRLSGVKKFNSKGEYLGCIGRRGRGPGEFLEITTMFISPDDELHLIDRLNMRLTKLTTTGEVIKTLDFPEKKMISPWQGKISETGEIYLLFRNYSIDSAEPLNKNIIHAYNNLFNKMENSIGNLELLGNIDIEFEDALIGGPTTAYFDYKKNNLILAPFLNTGKVFHFKKVNDTWNKSEYVQHIFSEKKYELFDIDKRPENAIVIGSKYGPFSATIFQSNAGAFFNSDSTFVVFSYQQNNENRYEFGANLYNHKRKEYLGYTKIEELSIPENNAFQASPVTPMWFDGEKYYFIDIRADDPKLIVATIDFNATYK